jgi:hypothetical protein
MKVVFCISKTFFDYVWDKPVFCSIVVENNCTVVFPRVLVVMIFSKIWVWHVFSRIYLSVVRMYNFINITRPFRNNSIMNIAVLPNRQIISRVNPFLSRIRASLPVKLRKVKSSSFDGVFVGNKEVFGITSWNNWVTHKWFVWATSIGGRVIMIERIGRC